LSRIESQCGRGRVLAWCKWRWASRVRATTADAHGVKTKTTPARPSGTNRDGKAVVGLRQCVAAAWMACSSILDADAAMATTCRTRTTSVMEPEDGMTANLTKDVAEGMNKRVHRR